MVCLFCKSFCTNSRMLFYGSYGRTRTCTSHFRSIGTFIKMQLVFELISNDYASAL